MIKKIGFLVILISVFAGIASASREPILKAGFVLNKGDEEFYSWILIHESSYYFKDLISIGYETQFSYYKMNSNNNNSEKGNSTYPLNIFFNSKVKILKKGIFRPYAGAGFGLLTNIITHPDRFTWEKFNAVHAIVGINIGKESGAVFQIELRLLSCDKEDSNTKFLLAGGVIF